MRSALLTLLLSGVVTVASGAALLLNLFRGDDLQAERSACRFLICNNALLLRTAYRELSQPEPESTTAAIAAFREALARNPASAYRWSDLGQAFLASGDTKQSQYCFERALDRGPNAPIILMRAANYHFQIGEVTPAMRCAARVMKQVPSYDGIIFSYYDRLASGMEQVLQYGLPEDRRVAWSYFRHCLRQSSESDVQKLWGWMNARSFAADRLAGEYVDYLLEHRSYETAVGVWSRQMGTRRRDYPDSNLLFNGDFESSPTEAAFDWRIQPCEGATAAPDSKVAFSGNRSLRIQFDGRRNLDYRHVSQRAVVVPGRKYRLQAKLRTEGITTDEGVRLRIFDAESFTRLDLATEPLIGTQNWKTIENAFVAPSQTHLVEVQILRRPSRKFDNTIGGTAWIDRVGLTLDNR